MMSKVAKPIKSTSTKITLDSFIRKTSTKRIVKADVLNNHLNKEPSPQGNQINMEESIQSSKNDEQKPVPNNYISDDEKSLIGLEKTAIAPEWLELINKELSKSYFFNLKRFLYSQNCTIFPPRESIYSFTQYCPQISKVKVLVLGQDPYHNFNQAHGLAFSVLSGRIPPSLKNIYKAIKIDYPSFEIPKHNGNLSPWSKQGVLLLNACLTVEAHKSNSHNNKGWEIFTSALITNLINYKNNVLDQEIIILAWGSNAQNLIDKKIGLRAINKKNNKENLVLKSVHPSPLSAARGFFDCHHFKLTNEWIKEKYGETEVIDWSAVKD